jgi:hypothetical protein
MKNVNYGRSAGYTIMVNGLRAYGTGVAVANAIRNPSRAWAVSYLIALDKLLYALSGQT